MPNKEEPEPASKKTFSLKGWLKHLFNFKPSNSLEETVTEIIEEYSPNHKKMTKEEQDILHNFLKFGEKKAEDILIPRAHICAVANTYSLEEIVETYIKQSHTRIIVYSDNLDNIIGFIHIKDIIPILSGKETFSINKVIRKILSAAPSMKLTDLLLQMRKSRTHIAVVIDEYGGTDGIITIEDIIEEIFGEIEDEYDEEDEVNSYKMLNNSTIIANAQMEIEELEKLLSVKLRHENDSFDTLGGLLLTRIGYLPKQGTIVPITENINAEVIEASPRNLKQVKISLTDVKNS